MSLPKIVITYGNGNLLQDVSAIDGVCGMVGTLQTGGLQGTPHQIFNLQDAIDLGITEDDEVDFYRQLKEFYDEVGGNQELWILGLADTVTMTAMLDYTSSSGAKKLINAAGGTIRLLGIFKTPADDYAAGGSNYMDADVSTAHAASKTFGTNLLSILQPGRILIEGRINLAHESSTTIYQPNSATNGFGGIVLGGSRNDGSASVGTALGRAAKYPAHIKIGKVANGSLALTTCYIGTHAIKDVSGLEALHDKGYISFMTYAQKAGFFFGIDHMGSTDDYRLLAYGRVVDKAAVIAATVYTEQIEGEVDVTADGKIAEIDLQHLQGLISQQIQVGMADQISSLDVYINPSQDVIDTGVLTIKLSITPKGYTSEIDIEIGLKSPAIS